MKSYGFLFLPLFFLTTTLEKGNSQFQETANSYIQQYTYKEFLNSTFSQRSIDPGNLDEELLIATLYFLLEKQRPKKAKLQPSDQLQKGTEVLLSELSSNRIQYGMRKRKLPTRRWERIVRSTNYKGTFLAMSAASVPCYNYPKRFKVHFDKSADSESPFYYQERKRKVSMETHTYLSIAEVVLQKAVYSDRKKLLTSKGLKDWACAVRVEDRGEGKMPMLSVVMLGGGYRLELLSK